MEMLPQVQVWRLGRKELGHAAATERAVSGPRIQNRLMIAPSTLPAMTVWIIVIPPQHQLR
jgi:hypothetical protein